MTGLKFPKPRPAILERHEKRTAIKRLDDQENKKVRRRSGGRCEVILMSEGQCLRWAYEIHHLCGGWRRRGRKESALALHKQHVCGVCHKLITGHVLKIITMGIVPQWDDWYERESD